MSNRDFELVIEYSHKQRPENSHTNHSLIPILSTFKVLKKIRSLVRKLRIQNILYSLIHLQETDLLSFFYSGS